MPQEILKNVYRISVPLPNNPLRELNSYLIRGEDRSVLIDTGFRLPACRQALEEGLLELKIRKEDTDVLLTHLHADHSGLAPEFVGETRNIYISETELPWMSMRNNNLWNRTIMAYEAAGFPAELLQMWESTDPRRSLAMAEPYTRYVGLRDGEKIQIGDYSLTCVLTPGHTPGHMCFWMEKQGVMLTGDHVLFDITPNITSWVGMEDALGAYLKSLQNVWAYDVKLALPGHRAAGDFHARIDTLLAHHEDRLLECSAVVAQTPGLTVYDIAAKMTWKIRSDNWETFPASQKWFAVGECASHLDHLLVLGQLSREKDGKVYRYFPVK